MLRRIGNPKTRNYFDQGRSSLFFPRVCPQSLRKVFIHVQCVPLGVWDDRYSLGGVLMKNRLALEMTSERRPMGIQVDKVDLF